MDARNRSPARVSPALERLVIEGTLEGGEVGFKQTCVSSSNKLQAGDSMHHGVLRSRSLKLSWSRGTLRSLAAARLCCDVRDITRPPPPTLGRRRVLLRTASRLLRCSPPQ